MGRIENIMKTCKLEATILKNQIEKEICDLQGEIMEFQALDMGGLKHKWYGDEGLYKNSYDELFNTIISNKTIDYAADILKEGIQKGVELLSILHKIKSHCGVVLSLQSTPPFNGHGSGSGSGSGSFEDEEVVNLSNIARDTLQQLFLDYDRILNYSDKDFKKYFIQDVNVLFYYFEEENIESAETVTAYPLTLHSVFDGAITEYSDVHWKALDNKETVIEGVNSTYKAINKLEDLIHKMKIQLDELNNVNNYVKIQKKDFEEKLLEWK